MKTKLTRDEAFALLCAVESLMSDRDEAATNETGLRHLDRDSGLDCPPAFADAYFSAIGKLEAITGCDLGSAEYWEPAECTESFMARVVDSMLVDKGDRP
jgi:hypothetical protein